MNDHLNALPSGFQIHEYELIRVLGIGGFGITYLAFDNNMDRACAIKEYLPNDLAIRGEANSVLAKSTQAQGEFDWGLDRFLFEARTLAKFDHRNIVKVYRSFTEHGTGYIVMEYAEGDTLSEYFKRKGVLTETEIKSVLMPILEGLQRVHASDFLHRDIKPGNIILRDSDNSAVLLDFGSARQAIGIKSKSVTAIVSAGYAPIEQYSSKGNQGPWTDIYALGALCYRALSGEVPDDATERIRRDPLVPLGEKCDGISDNFLKAVAWALRVDEEDRPQHISQWLAVLKGEQSIPDIGSANGAATPVSDATALADKNVASEQETAQLTAGTESHSPKQPFYLAAGIGLVATVLVAGYLFLDSGGSEDQIRVDGETIDGGTTDGEAIGSETIVDTIVVDDRNEVVSEISEPRVQLISAGSFDMGDVLGVGEADELPVHEVFLGRDFYITNHEISIR
ncbi:MAG: hypothetical protein COC19_06490 [SAR86 cluster bacterium]|uniref:non-specific serine/threonine protein kinase n=1 Tax=SAR86 cluster bacterium TaxID=2030880 RepID=A0A2A4MK12_9GAMM|nr:MAG: hypothetical protein COC19_06490 [SAR86 cluster bacterium]